MGGIILLELTSLISFVFSILIFILTNTSIDNFIIIFLYMVFLSYLGASLKKKNKRYLYTCILMFLPAIIYHTISDIIFLTAASLYIYYYIYQYFGETRFELIKEGFLKRLILYIIIIFFDLIFGIFRSTDKGYIIFMIIYFISTILLLRSFRHLEYDLDISKINRTNFFYAMFAIIAMPIFGSSTFRQAIRSIYDFIIDLIFNIVYWPIVILASLIGKLVAFIVSLISDNVEDPAVQDIIMGFTNEDILASESNQTPIWLRRIVAVIFAVILILILYYVIKRLLKRKTSRKKDEETGYVEEREFINIRDKNRKINKPMLFPPKDLRDQIRYYYKKYIAKSKKRGIDIENSDTSLEVNKKSNEVFENKTIEDIRDIYIEVRYGERDTDKIEVDKMKKLYKNL